MSDYMTYVEQDKKNNSTNNLRRVLRTATLADDVVDINNQWHKPVSLPLNDSQADLVTADLPGTPVTRSLTESTGDLEFSSIIHGIEVCASTDSTLTLAAGARLIQSRLESINLNRADNGYSASFDGRFVSIGDTLSCYAACWSSSEGSSLIVGSC